MLKEIRCAKFVSNGFVREPICFSKGLNTVLGNSFGANSIGKSTFLMIIDFAFGGNDYADKSVDVLTNVGDHIIQFCFEFEGKSFYFSRSPITKNEVSICDASYKVTSIISLDHFRKFLYKKYQIKSKEQSFRGAVGNYFRIYLRECCDEGHPLKSSDGTPDKVGILELIKLFNQYDVVGELIKEQKEIKEKELTYKKAISFNQISAPKNKKEFNSNVKEIESLSSEISNLIEKSNAGLLEIDSITARKIAEIKGILSKLRRQRTRIKVNLATLMDECKTKKQVEIDFSELLQYFPNANTKTLEEIENFHIGISNALTTEYEEQKTDLEDMLELVEEEISQKEGELKKINPNSDVSKAILDSYADAKQKYNNLQDANRHYEEVKRLKEKLDEIGNKISQTFKSELSLITFNLNGLMDEYNRYIYHENRSAPTIEIKDESHYVFDTPNDRGTGSRYKGLILFDLAVLNLTMLPAVVHDSFMLKQIEDSVLEKILEIYMKTDKQVFIAIDKETSYSERTQEILNKTVVLRLSPNGNELFGKSWNKKNKDNN